MEINTRSELMPNNTLQKKLEQGAWTDRESCRVLKKHLEHTTGAAVSWFILMIAYKKKAQVVHSQQWSKVLHFVKDWTVQHSSLCVREELKDFNTQYHQKIQRILWLHKAESQHWSLWPLIPQTAPHWKPASFSDGYCNVGYKRELRLYHAEPRDQYHHYY